MIPAAGAFTAGARSRLLPASVSLRYFGAAVLYHVFAWALLVAYPTELERFAAYGGLGPALAALHLVTLGVLAMTAVGATLQLFPIATRQAVRSVAAARFVWWLLAPGVALFAAGAASYRPQLLGAGAALAVAGLAVYAWLLFENLRRARGMRAVVAHGWGALAGLVLLAASGLALVAHYEHGLALDRGAFAAAHLLLAAYGFMGLLALGLSQFLLPMFAVSPAPSARSAFAALAAAIAAMLVALAALYAASEPLVGAAALLGLAAAAAHIAAMEGALRRRLRPQLGPAFLLVRVAWACLLASLALAALAAFGWAPPHAAALFGVLLVPGWLLTFLLAVLQRIVPFLATVHAGGRGRGAPLVSSFTPARTLAAHRILHLAALALLIAGAALASPWLVRAAAAAGLAAALAYGAFFVRVLARLKEE
ncbi:MAG TPA: hypothetical protein VEH51_15240 [Burkholderiales bacterium]|nr:hypothetical protein [Burkholderiales bacterium]